MPPLVAKWTATGAFPDSCERP